MEIIPQCVGAMKIDPTPERLVTVTFTKTPLVLRMSAQEAIEYGRRMVAVG